jgi:hypothetical protein
MTPSGLRPFTFLLCALIAFTATASGSERWQKIDANGKPLPVHEGPWSCVLDRDTGLLWENKSDNEGLHYATATFSWFDAASGAGRAASGSCYNEDGEMYGCDTQAYARLASSERWCGRNDWRLPAAAELQSLLFDTGYAGAPRIATGFFPHTGRFPYWSADRRDDGATQQAVLVDFANGDVFALPLDRVARVRLVSGAAGRPGAGEPVR